MTENNRKSLRGLTVIGLSCLAVVACAPQQGEFGDKFFPHAKWEQVPPSPDNMVEVVTLRHVVAFPSNQSGLEGPQRASIEDFIRSNRISARDQIVVQPGAADSGRLTSGRVSAVRNEFAQYGLVASEGQGGSGGAAVAGDEVAVLITRAVVITPDCSVPQPEPTLRPDHKFGCHVNSALGMMVADPLDLVEGRELGPADGEQASGALRRYRQDKVKEINKEETTN